MKARRLVPLSALVLVATVACACTQTKSGGVSGRLLAKMSRGLNVTRWFCYLNNPADTSHYDKYMLDADFANFRRLRVGWIRLCVSPASIYANGHLNLTTLPYLDRAITRIQAAGMVAVLDLHDNGELKLDQPGRDEAGFLNFWQEMTKHFLGRGESGVVFELLNEPQFSRNPADWYALQERAVKAIRQIDPARTIMVSDTNWSGIDALAGMQPLPEKNLLYTFHCYDPFFFTHQGASWVGDPPKDLKAMPFPSSPEAVAPILAQNPPTEQQTVKNYGNQRFGAPYLRSRLAIGMAWGARYAVPIILGEFGAYPPVSPPESRASWFLAMRAAISGLRVPSAVWGYDDIFGLGRSVDIRGIVHLDPVTLKNLYNTSAP